MVVNIPSNPKQGVGENIAKGQKSVAEAVNDWFRSPGHCANIMNPNFTEMGIDYFVSKGGSKYWVQVLGSPMKD